MYSEGYWLFPKFMIWKRSKLDFFLEVSSHFVLFSQGPLAPCGITDHIAVPNCPKLLFLGVVAWGDVRVEITCLVNE